MFKNFPKQTFKAVVAAILLVAAAAFLIKKYGNYRQYVYAIDPATGKPTGKPLNVITCQFGKPTDFTAAA